MANEPKMISPKEWGKRHGVKYSTVIGWLRQGLIPGAVKTELPSGGYHYSIPEDAPKPETKRGPKPQFKPEVVKTLDALRQFGSDKLSEEEKEAIAEDHAKHFFELVKTAYPKLFGAEQNTWLDRLDYEQNNLRAALDYYGSKETTATTELEMAVYLGHFWDVRGYWSEGRERLQHALSRQRPGASPLKAQGLGWLGLLALSQDDYDHAKQILSESAEMSKQSGDQGSLGFASLWLGFIAEARGNYEEAKSLLSASLESAYKAKWIWLSAWALRGLGVVARAEGNPELARDYYQQSLSNSTKIGDVRETADTLNCLGVIARETGNYDQARRFHERGLALAQGSGDKDAISLSYTKLALLEEAAGQYREALHLYQQGLALSQEIGNRLRMAKCLEGVAKMAEVLGNRRDAARIYGAADALRAMIAAPLSTTEQKQHSQAIDSAKNDHSSDWRKGSRWPLDEAIAYALSFDQIAA